MKTMPRIFAFVALVLSALAVMLLPSGCNPEENFNDAATLRFSVDTLQFDTVFTELGQTTLRFKVYNTLNEPIRVKRVFVAGGQASPFRVNIDGSAGQEFRDLTLGANDSTYIFAKVYINPNGSNLPLVVKDSIWFQTEKGSQKVILYANGQDAHYIGKVGYLTRITPQEVTVFKFGSGQLVRRYTDSRFSGSSPTLPIDKPWVMKGWVLIDSSMTLNIPAGAQMHMLGGPRGNAGDRAFLIIDSNSTLNIQGTASQPVEFKTHRLEDDYQDLPFQWQGIYLTVKSKNNNIRHARIRNCLYGVIADSLQIGNARAKLDIRNTIVYNVAESSILGIGSRIYAENCVFANSDQYNLLLIRGGDYKFNHCTVVNYGTNVFVSRNQPIMGLRNYIIRQDNNGTKFLFENPMNASFENCIIHGTKPEEIQIDKARNTTAALDYRFENCVIKADTVRARLVNCIRNPSRFDTTFVKLDKYDYQIKSRSVARDAGKLGLSDYLGIPIGTDFKDNIRDGSPDIGAYEFQ